MRRMIPAAIARPAAAPSSTVISAAVLSPGYKRGLGERGWPETTDCDRLDRAFATLAAESVVARQHLWCCTRCAVPAITPDRAIVLLDDLAPPPQGYRSGSRRRARDGTDDPE